MSRCRSRKRFYFSWNLSRNGSSKKFHETDHVTRYNACWNLFRSGVVWHKFQLKVSTCNGCLRMSIVGFLFVFSLYISFSRKIRTRCRRCHQENYRPKVNSVIYQHTQALRFTEKNMSQEIIPNSKFGKTTAITCWGMPDLLQTWVAPEEGFFFKPKYRGNLYTYIFPFTDIQPSRVHFRTWIIWLENLHVAKWKKKMLHVVTVERKESQ